MSDTQSSIPTYYDPRVRVKPCAPDRVPYLPDQVLYLIASALPNPKSVFNFALASKATWENLQPALWKCEVTYESRLGQIYGGTSSDSLQQHFRKHLRRSDTNEDSEQASTTDPENCEQIPLATGKNCQHGRIPEQCIICGDRIRLENRTFESPLPDILLFTNRRLTALHWACKKGPSALPLARNLIRSALVHQPSYIDGVGLRERLYHGSGRIAGKLMPGDLPPPLFLAVAYGNIEVCKALIDAGCNVNLLQGQSQCQELPPDQDDWEPLMAFKVHKDCVMSRGQTAHEFTVPLECVCQWVDMFSIYGAPGCQTAGHVAIQYKKSEILKMLLRYGLDIQRGLLPLANYSVVEGDLDAVKVLLEHDPSLIHRIVLNRPLIHAVPNIIKKQGEDAGAHYERVKKMLEYLLAKGANIDSETGDELDAIDTEYLAEGGMTALQTVLAEARVYAAFMPMVWDLLTAAEVFVRGGANWNRPVFSRVQSEGLLECSLINAVGIVSDRYTMDDSGTAVALETRKGWGRVVKAMVETASHQEANLAETFSNAFTYLVNFHDPVNGPNRFGPWGIEAVGKLLLSTGITPSPEAMERWKILCLNREAWISEDGDRSQWEFLCAGINADQLKIEWNTE